MKHENTIDRLASSNFRKEKMLQKVERIEGNVNRVMKAEKKGYKAMEGKPD
jgi:hypothetical protein